MKPSFPNTGRKAWFPAWAGLALALGLSVATPCPGAEPKLVLRNPGMEDGNDVPEGWRGKFGKVLVMRDTETFHSGSASLSVQNSASGSGCGHQMMAVKPGLKLKLGGWVKCEEGAKVNFAAQFFDEKFTWNEFNQVKFLEGSQEWEQAEKEITVPEKASHMAIALYVEGVGRAWLDDVTLTSEGVTVEVPVPDPVPKLPKEPADAKLVPTTSLPGHFTDQPKAWMIYHDSHLKRAKEGGIDVLFLGDSITQGWGGAGKEAWDASFAPLHAAHFGIGGDKTGNLLWRIENGEVDGLAPKLVVLMIGVNNLWTGKNTGEEITGGIRAIVEKLRAKLPQTKVLVLGVLPIGATETETGRIKVQEINVHAALLDDGAMVKFVDFGPKLVQKNGKLLEDASAPDNLHLTSKGYGVLAKELLPLVTELVK